MALLWELLAIEDPATADLDDISGLWTLYRAALLYAIQLPLFRNVTESETDAASRRFTYRFVQKWDTTSPRISKEARRGLSQVQAELDWDRATAKWRALEVGLRKVLTTWEQPREIRIRQQWIHRGGEKAQFHRRGLKELGTEEKLCFRTDDHEWADGILMSVNGFAVLIRHVRRRMINKAEAWLGSHEPEEDLPEELDRLPLEEALTGPAEDRYGRSLATSDPDPTEAPPPDNRYDALLEAADCISSAHREALECLSPHQTRRLQRSLELYADAGSDADDAEIKSRLAQEDRVSVNAIETLFSRLNKAVSSD